MQALAGRAARPDDDRVDVDKARDRGEHDRAVGSGPARKQFGGRHNDSEQRAELEHDTQFERVLQD